MKLTSKENGIYSYHTYFSIVIIIFFLETYTYLYLSLDGWDRLYDEF